MDIQNDFIGERARMPVAKHHVQPMLDKINMIIEKTYSFGLPIVYIGNEFEQTQWIANWFRNHAALKGKQGALLDKRLRIVNDIYFSKKAGSALSNPKLVEYITKNGITHLVITGLFTEGCVTATTKDGLRREQKVTVLKDAVASGNDSKREKAIVKLLKQGAACINSQEFLDGLVST